jgi:hypothetical protein
MKTVRRPGQGHVRRSSGRSEVVDATWRPGSHFIISAVAKVHEGGGLAARTPDVLTLLHATS